MTARSALSGWCKYGLATKIRPCCASSRPPGHHLPTLDTALLVASSSALGAGDRSPAFGSVSCEGDGALGPSCFPTPLSDEVVGRPGWQLATVGRQRVFVLLGAGRGGQGLVCIQCRSLLMPPQCCLVYFQTMVSVLLVTPGQWHCAAYVRVKGAISHSHL